MERSEGRGGSRAAATSKMERFVVTVNGLKPLTIITKRSILDVTAALDPPLERVTLTLTSAVWSWKSCGRRMASSYFKKLEKSLLNFCYSCHNINVIIRVCACVCVCVCVFSFTVKASSDWSKQ